MKVSGVFIVSIITWCYFQVTENFQNGCTVKKFKSTETVRIVKMNSRITKKRTGERVHKHEDNINVCFQKMAVLKRTENQ